MNRLQSKALWFTGLPSAGKSTLAYHVHSKLLSMGYESYVLDGDEIRASISADLGFTLEDRAENIRRVSEITKSMLKEKRIVSVALISPLAKDREIARTIIGKEYFLEIHVNTPLAICEQRDVKGYYKKARQNRIKNFTGISSPYEKPLHPDLRINTAEHTEESCCSLVLQLLSLDK